MKAIVWTFGNVTKLRALSALASSASVERVFSYGGLILKPHRLNLSDKMLTSLISQKQF